MAASTRETALIKNSLITLLQAIVGRRTTVDLRREDSVEGLLVNVDAFMNLTLKEVRLISAVDGRPDCYLEELFVQGREIRYVHIPDDMNIMDSITRQLNWKKDYMMKQKSHLEKLTKKKILKRQKESVKREKKEFEALTTTAAATATVTATDTATVTATDTATDTATVTATDTATVTATSSST